MHGWLVHHPLPSMNRRGIWATHELGDHGFPDLVLAHHQGVLYLQNLKAIKAKSHRCNHDGLQRFNKAPWSGCGGQPTLTGYPNI
jgi:hypothetical protein